MRIVEQIKNHFSFVKLISTARLSILHCDLYCNKRDIMYKRRTPIFPFLSYLYGVVRPSISNLVTGNELSSFVSEVRKMSRFICQTNAIYPEIITSYILVIYKNKIIFVTWFFYDLVNLIYIKGSSGRR